MPERRDAREAAPPLGRGAAIGALVWVTAVVLLYLGIQALGLRVV